MWNWFKSLFSRKQKVEVFDSKYFLSVYPTEKSTSTFMVKTKEIHYKSHEEDKKQSDKIVYGPYTDIPPVTFEQITLMFTFMYPLPSFTDAQRDIFVSHWGSIAIDEHFNITNSGAGINGQFSRTLRRGADSVLKEMGEDLDLRLRGVTWKGGFYNGFTAPVLGGDFAQKSQVWRDSFPRVDRYSIG